MLSKKFRVRIIADYQRGRIELLVLRQPGSWPRGRMYIGSNGSNSLRSFGHPQFEGDGYTVTLFVRGYNNLLDDQPNGVYVLPSRIPPRVNAAKAMVAAAGGTCELEVIRG